jgi:hypothetical protein
MKRSRRDRGTRTGRLLGEGGGRSGSSVVGRFDIGEEQSSNRRVDTVCSCES